MILSSCTHVVVNEQGDITDMSIDPANKLLATGSNDNHIRIWNLQPTEQLESGEWRGLGENIIVLQGSGAANSAINCLQFSPSPERPYLVACTQDGMIYLYRYDDWTIEPIMHSLSTRRTSEKITSLEWDAFGNEFVTAGNSHLYLWRIVTTTDGRAQLQLAADLSDYSLSSVSCVNWNTSSNDSLLVGYVHISHSLSQSRHLLIIFEW